MSQKHVFTPKELRLLSTPLADRISQSIDHGRYEEAKSLALQLEAESTANIYAFEDFVTALLSYIYKNHGDGSLEASLTFCADILIKPLHDSMADLSFRETVEAFAALFRSHTGRGLTIKEDNEKVTLVLNPCGSGGRMVKDGYFAPPKNLLNIKDAKAITFGRKDFPSYCCHCAVLHHIMPIQWSGKPFPPIEVGDGPGEPCKWHFYKDLSAIPKRYYEQVGKKKE